MSESQLFPPVIDTFQPVTLFSKSTPLSSVRIYFQPSLYNSIDIEAGNSDAKSLVFSIRSQKGNLSVLTLNGITQDVDVINITEVKLDTNSGLYYFTLDRGKCNKALTSETGEVYKVQLRFASQVFNGGSPTEWANQNMGSLSEWSTVSLLKLIETSTIAITVPSIIDGVAQYQTPLIQILGSVQFKPVNTEILSKYKISIKNFDTEEILETSDWIIADQDNAPNSFSYKIKTVLESSLKYIACIECLTNNNYHFATEYDFVIKTEVKNIPFLPTIKSDNFNARNIITITSKGDISDLGSYTGLALLRSDADSNFTQYEEIKLIELQKYKTSDGKSLAKDIIIYDFTIESFKPYAYAIQLAGPQGIRGNIKYVTLEEDEDRIIDIKLIQDSDIKPYSVMKEENNTTEEEKDPTPIFSDVAQPLICDYEYNYLLGDGRQLKISLNENINSLKPNIQDSVIETLGGRYPIVTRNSSMNYRTFSIEGLISILTDDNDYFDYQKVKENYNPLTISENQIFGTFTTKEELLGSSYHLYDSYNRVNNINDHNNIYLERKYRELVIKFLTSATPKLFKSSQEGIILVKLSNVSLSPNAQLNRMVYSFSCEATEIDEATIANIDKYNVQNIGDILGATQAENKYTTIITKEVAILDNT